VDNFPVLDELGSQEGFGEHVSRHARGGALGESNDAVLDLILERVDAKINQTHTRNVRARPFKIFAVSHKCVGIGAIQNGNSFEKSIFGFRKLNLSAQTNL
jgi:hypothetical protein